MISNSDDRDLRILTLNQSFIEEFYDKSIQSLMDDPLIEMVEEGEDRRFMTGRADSDLQDGDHRQSS